MSKQKKAEAFAVDDFIRDGHLVNALEILCFFSAVRVGADLYLKADGMFDAITSQQSWANTIGLGKDQQFREAAGDVQDQLDKLGEYIKGKLP